MSQARTHVHMIYMEETYGNLLAIREKYHQKVLKNIERAQQRQKAQYSAKRGTLHVWVIMVLCVYILKTSEILLRVLDHLGSLSNG